MKRIFLLTLCVLVLAGCSAEPEKQQTELDNPSASEPSSSTNPPSVPESSIEPLTEYALLNAWDLLDTAPLQIDGSWSYFCASIQTTQGEQTILARENPKGDSEVLLTLPIAGAYISYVENSLQQSGNQRLYFTVPTEAVGQNEVYSFRLSDNQISKLLPAPCSNMIVPSEPPKALSGFGWLVYENKVVGVDLAAGQPYQGNTLDSELDGHFFYGIGAEFDTKYTVIEAVNNDVLTLKTIQYDSLTSASEKATQLYYSVSSEQYTNEPISNFTPSTQPPAQPAPASSIGEGNSSCMASGCSAAAKYGSYCVDHVCMVNGCFNERYPGDRYCATHSDLVDDAPEYACAWPGGCTVRAKYGKYCSDHVCRYVTCTYPKLPDSKYCDYHAQSNLCKQSGCYNFVDGGGYCEEHEN